MDDGEKAWLVDPATVGDLRTWLMASPFQQDKRAAREIERLQAENANMRDLLAETLKVGAYGTGSTLAQRVQDSLDFPKDAHDK